MARENTVVNALRVQTLEGEGKLVSIRTMSSHLSSVQVILCSYLLEIEI